MLKKKKKSYMIVVCVLYSFWGSMVAAGAH